METFESLTQRMPIYYRLHEDVVHGGKVDTLTETGLRTYFERRQTEERDALEHTTLIMDYDLKAGPSFSTKAQIKLRAALSGSCEGRKSFIIHRDGHTVSVIREGDTFLLLDSYNAHGTKDCDHFPLLKIIREENPKAKIYTLHDKTQSDYYSCRIFSVENLVEIEKYCAAHQCGLSEIIRDSADVPFFYETSDQKKDEFYTENSIIPIGTPIPILHHVQSMEYIVSTFNKMLDAGNAQHISYVFGKLHPHLRVNPKAKPKPQSRLHESLHGVVNLSIEELSRENARKLAVEHRDVESIISNAISLVIQKAISSRIPTFTDRVIASQVSVSTPQLEVQQQ